MPNIYIVSNILFNYINMHLGKNIKKYAIVGLVILLLSIFSGCIEEKEPEIGEELSLQELINNAKSGETVYLEEKTYFENIKIDKELTLIGKNSIIDGNGSEIVIEINQNNVKISNLIIRNSGGKSNNAGIKLSSDNNLIENCEIYRTKTGIIIDESQDNVISNCKFHTNGEGVYFYSSSKNMISNSEFQHNAFGIHLFDSSEIVIEGSYIHTNGLGIYARDSEKLEVVHSAISDNNQDGGGYWLFNCIGSTISNCNIDHNGAGIKLKNSDLEISDCNLHYNMYNTFRITHSEDVFVSNCDIRDSFRTAFFI